MLSERLKELRKKANLTQKDMADYFGTSQPSYQAWESGKRKPNSESLDKIANFFNVSTDYLLGNTDQKNAFDIDEEALEASLRKSIGYNGQPPTEQEIENMKNALIDYLKNR
ncbi:helix-turn-helix domain-containing protein [Streptococcus pluranimalium]|uniref:helix-turn-helix domain-containing protein n=1 Tax=Streptococcus pluranimalium TaxID=82348 RepID=UPI0039FD6CB2